MPVPASQSSSLGARIFTFTKRQLKRKVVRAALAVAIGMLAGSLCQMLPAKFREPCHLAARICHTLLTGQVR